MVCIVMPAKNEAGNIALALDNCLGLPFDLIIAVVNGSTDNTEEVIRSHTLFIKNKIRILKFTPALGIDVPRAIGAAYAYKVNCKAVVFLDGDMTGNVASNLLELIHAITIYNDDMALTNCYPYITYRAPMVRNVLGFRERLNRQLNLFSALGVALPSHGPHSLSRRCLEVIPWEFIAIPPLSLAMAAQHKLNIKVATSIPHKQLLSAPRSIDHGLRVAETIIGDCIETINYSQNGSRDRSYKGQKYLGYHPGRRFDLLDQYVASLNL